MDPMKDALAKRRGKGFDLTISIMPHDDKNNKTDDLAPPPGGDDEGKMGSPEDMAMAGKPGGDAPMDPAAAPDPKEYFGSPSDEELQAKPKSLFERARQGAFMKGKK